MSGGRNQRSAEAQAWRHLYKGPAWQALRKRVLLRDLYTCQVCGCMLTGKHPAPNSPVVDHIKEHKGDPVLFFDEANCQSLDKACHDGAKQSSEKRGYEIGVTADGRPIDRHHPWNRA